MSRHRVWRCPECGHVPLVSEFDNLSCPSCRAVYPTVFETPVLLRADNEVFVAKEYLEGPSPGRARSRLGRLLPNPSVNLSFRRIMPRLAEMLGALDRTPAVLLIGSGDQREAVKRALENGRRVMDVVAVDVDPRADVDAFCDAHDLPLPDGSFDAVICTAVLEHVLDPERVVAELRRVLRPCGLVYTEIPFMQQVHEGAYDFTRYSMSGHRRLMRHFDELDKGAVAGPGTALAWSLERFLISVAPSRLDPVMRAVSRLLFSWVKYVDFLVAARPVSLDAASCTYFFGRRREREPISDAEVVAGYRGGAHWSPGAGSDEQARPGEPVEVP
jgi:SAM-dependent methyltransferase